MLNNLYTNTVQIITFNSLSIIIYYEYDYTISFYSLLIYCITAEILKYQEYQKMDINLKKVVLILNIAALSAIIIFESEFKKLLSVFIYAVFLYSFNTPGMKEMDSDLKPIIVLVTLASIYAILSFESQFFKSISIFIWVVTIYRLKSIENEFYNPEFENFMFYFMYYSFILIALMVIFYYFYW